MASPCHSSTHAPRNGVLPRASDPRTARPPPSSTTCAARLQLRTRNQEGSSSLQGGRWPPPIFDIDHIQRHLSPRGVNTHFASGGLIRAQISATVEIGPRLIGSAPNCSIPVELRNSTSEVRRPRPELEIGKISADSMPNLIEIGPGSAESAPNLVKRTNGDPNRPKQLEFRNKKQDCDSTTRREETDNSALCEPGGVRVPVEEGEVPVPAMLQEANAAGRAIAARDGHGLPTHEAHVRARLRSKGGHCERPLRCGLASSRANDRTLGASANTVDLLPWADSPQAGRIVDKWSGADISGKVGSSTEDNKGAAGVARATPGAQFDPFRSLLPSPEVMGSRTFGQKPSTVPNEGHLHIPRAPGPSWRCVKLRCVSVPNFHTPTHAYPRDPESGGRQRHPWAHW